MNNIKCPQCGLVNFASTPECKRCHHEFVVAVKSVIKPAVNPVIKPIVKPVTNPVAKPIEVPLARPAIYQPIQTATTTATNTTTPFEPLPEFEAEATPIGGWLILFAIGLGLSLAISILGIQKYASLFSAKEFHLFTSQGSTLYIPGLSAGTTFEFIWLSLVAASSILLLIRFFRRSSSFPRLAIAILSLNIVVAFIDYFMALNIKNELMRKLVAVYGRGNVPELLPSYVGWIILYAIVTSVLWIGYFLTSRRVESTFIY